jgi:hypothetical protein
MFGALMNEALRLFREHARDEVQNMLQRGSSLIPRSISFGFWMKQRRTEGIDLELSDRGPFMNISSAKLWIFKSEKAMESGAISESDREETTKHLTLPSEPGTNRAAR